MKMDCFIILSVDKEIKTNLSQSFNTRKTEIFETDFLTKID